MTVTGTLKPKAFVGTEHAPFSKEHEQIKLRSPMLALKRRIPRCSGLGKRLQTTSAVEASTSSLDCSSSPPSPSRRVVMDKDIIASIRKYDALQPRPQRLQDIIKVSSSSPSFIQAEFRIRCAERICMIEERIPNFAEIPELEEVHARHVESFVEMRNSRPYNKSSLEDFLPVVRSIVERDRDTISLMCQGMSRLISTHQHEYDEAFTNTFMNEFLLNRIGSNVIMSQYLAVATGGTSIIDPNCDVPAICRETAREVKQLCFQETGYRPTIKVESFQGCDGSVADCGMDNFAFIPAAVSYIVQELLKNSAVATARLKQKQKKNLSGTTIRVGGNRDETISVVVSADERRVMIHVGDRAGGIPFDVGQVSSVM